jgi:zinc transporter ZupT
VKEVRTWIEKVYFKSEILYCKVKRKGAGWMKPSESLYWIRASLGVVIGALSALYDYAIGWSLGKNTLNDFFTGLAFAFMFFIITYYILKLYYFDKFRKKSKVMSTGIGIYFLLWIVVWILVNTVFR